MTITTLPTLTGSDKQIAWAESIRDRWLPDLRAVIDAANSIVRDPGLRQIIVDAALAQIDDTTARGWIDLHTETRQLVIWTDRNIRDNVELRAYLAQISKGGELPTPEIVAAGADMFARRIYNLAIKTR